MFLLHVRMEIYNLHAEGLDKVLDSFASFYGIREDDSFWTHGKLL